MQGRKFFLNVTKGAFSEKANPGETATSFNEITGHLVHINFKSTGFGEAMRLHVVDENNFYILSMFVKSRPANAFFMIMQNLDLTNEMTFKITSKHGKDFFEIHQFGGPVLWYYSTLNVHELPSMPEEKRSVLIEYVIKDLAPTLQKKANPYPSHMLYKPCRKGLQGGYFDGFKSVGRIIGPVSETERNGFKDAEKW